MPALGPPHGWLQPLSGRVSPAQRQTIAWATRSLLWRGKKMRPLARCTGFLRGRQRTRRQNDTARARSHAGKGHRRVQAPKVQHQPTRPCRSNIPCTRNTNGAIEAGESAAGSKPTAFVLGGLNTKTAGKQPSATFSRNIAAQEQHGQKKQWPLVCTTDRYALSFL
jgi:hypothetical protein